MRKHLRLSVLALAAMFAGGAYAQDPASLGLAEEDDLLYRVTEENCNEHLWMFGYDDEQNDPEAAKAGFNSEQEKGRMKRLIDGDLNTYTQSDWSRADRDANFQQFLDVYLDHMVEGPMIAAIGRRNFPKNNGHVILVDIWASDGSAVKHAVKDFIPENVGEDKDYGVADFKGWEKIAQDVNVSSPEKGTWGLTDLFTAEKKYKYFRFEFKLTNHGSRWNYAHISEFRLYNLTPEQAAPIQLKSDYALYAEYLEKKPETFMGTDYYKYTDEDSYNSFMEDLKKVADFVDNENLSNEQALALHTSVNENFHKLMDSEVLYQVPEAGYYRVEFVDKPGFCAYSNYMYGDVWAAKIDPTDARQLWYMEPAGLGKTLCTNAVDGSFIVQGTGTRVTAFTPRVYTTYKEGIEDAKEFTTIPCSFDYVNAGNDANGLPIVAMRPPSAPNGAKEVMKGGTDEGYYVSCNQHNSVGNAEENYCCETDAASVSASHVVVVRVPDAEAKKIIDKSSYFAYNQLQELIEQANDLLDIAADAENCLSTVNGDLLRDLGAISVDGTCAPRGYHKIDVDLGSKVEDGVNVFMQYAAGGNGGNPIEWRVYGSNDNANWTLLDPCYNSNLFKNNALLPLNLGKGYQYLRFICWLSWSGDNYSMHENWINLSAFRIYRADRLSKAQIENAASQTFLKAVQKAMDVTNDKATQADVDGLAAAIETYKAGLADPTALRKLLAQTKYLAEGADFTTEEEPGYFTKPVGNDFGKVWTQADNYANNGEYTKDWLDTYFNMLMEEKAKVEAAAIKVDPNAWYFLNFMDEDTYNIFAEDWSGAACSDDSGNLFNLYLNAESTEEGAKFVFDADYDVEGGANSLSYYRFVENGDTYAIVNGCGLYLSLVNGQPRLSATPTYFNVTPVGYGLVTITTADCALSADLATKSLDTAADANCNTNGAFFITFAEEAEPFDAIQKVEAKSFKAGAIYSIDGKQVNDNFKGVVIKNGSKFLNK